MASNEVDYSDKGKQKTSRLRSFCNGIWNSEKKEVLGRTGSSWAKIGAFYLIFYSCLAGFFAVMLVGFFATVSEKEPTMQDKYSLLKMHPGMGFRPMPSHETTLIQFNHNDSETYKEYIDDLVTYLKDNDYLTEEGNYTKGGKDEDGMELFTLSDAMLHGCKYDPQNHYGSFGYAEGKPCVLLKMNKVYGWKPENFTEEFFNSMPGINNTVDRSQIGHAVTDIKVTCEGENDGDIDNLKKVDFYPPEGFKAAYFPYKNAKGYRSPLVFAQFSEVRKGVILQMWCKFWAMDIKHHKNDKAGSVRFEMVVDYTPPPKK